MNNQPVCNLREYDDKNLPSIEVLVLCKKSDFDLLPFVIRLALQNSLNPIESVRIVVPDHEVGFIKNLNLELPRNAHSDIEFHADSRYISKHNIEIIRRRLPDRLGWVAQQVIANVAIRESNSKNVLLVDADTLLLRKHVWIDGGNNQVLMPTEEYHRPYYDFLISQSGEYSHSGVSFVSHHMLYQVDVFRRIMENLGGIDYCLSQAIKWATDGEQSPFDLKYEPYSQYMYLRCREKVILQKWANISLQRPGNLKTFLSLDKLDVLSKHYNSVSFHHWNVEKELSARV